MTKAASDLCAGLERLTAAPVAYNVPLAEVSRWRIGGPASALVEPGSVDEVLAVLRFMNSRPEPLVVIGQTTNILFDSRGFEGVLLRIGERMAGMAIDGSDIRVQAGASVPTLVRAAANAGLGGIIHAAGIPGTVGGLVVMNGGTQRRGIGEHVIRAWAASPNGEVHEYSKSELGFAYRTSTLQSGHEVVLEVELRLEPGEASLLNPEIDRILAEREAKFPLDLPNCGSTFLSDPSMYQTVGPPGRVIEEAGFRGARRGGAQVSPLHANFIVNMGGALDTDVLWLIAEIRRVVYQRTGYALECEVRHLSVDGVLRPAHKAADEYWPELACEGESSA